MAVVATAIDLPRFRSTKAPAGAFCFGVLFGCALIASLPVGHGS
jgi:hypothetical protein